MDPPQYEVRRGARARLLPAGGLRRGRSPREVPPAPRDHSPAGDGQRLGRGRLPRRMRPTVACFIFVASPSASARHGRALTPLLHDLAFPPVVTASDGLGVVCAIGGASGGI